MRVRVTGSARRAVRKGGLTVASRQGCGRFYGGRRKAVAEHAKVLRVDEFRLCSGMVVVLRVISPQRAATVRTLGFVIFAFGRILND